MSSYEFDEEKKNNYLTFLSVIFIIGNEGKKGKLKNNLVKQCD